MPVYRFGSDILLPYMRETDRDRKPTTRQREALCSRHLLEFFDDMPVSYGKRGKLDGSAVRRYRETRRLSVSAETVKRELALASRACAYAISEWDYDMPQPFAGRLISARDRAVKPQTWHVLTRAEEARLLLAASPLARDIIVFALATGCRQAEILGLRWEQLDGDLIHFAPDQQKANRYSTRALSDAALSVLARQPENGPLVFHESGRPIGRFRWHHQMWHPARIKAGLPGFRFHWLRKTCGQRMLDAGASMVAVQYQLGHAESRTTERAYVREPLSVIRDAVRLVEKQAN